MADRLAVPGTLQRSPAGFSGRTASLELPAAPSSRQTCTRHGSRSLQVQCQMPSTQQNARSRPAGPRQDSVQACAMAVTWDTYWPEPEEALREQADAGGGADSRPGFFAPNTPTLPARPLKINRDLLLVSLPSWVLGPAVCAACSMCLTVQHRSCMAQWTAQDSQGKLHNLQQQHPCCAPAGDCAILPLLVALQCFACVALCIMHGPMLPLLLMAPPPASCSTALAWLGSRPGGRLQQHRGSTYQPRLRSCVGGCLKWMPLMGVPMWGWARF